MSEGGKASKSTRITFCGFPAGQAAHAGSGPDVGRSLRAQTCHFQEITTTQFFFISCLSGKVVHDDNDQADRIKTGRTRSVWTAAPLIPSSIGDFSIYE
jgi:hypothetical protein